MTIHFYGIPNCDTVKKARTWLDGQGLAYTFHDYKKEGADAAKLEGWAGIVGWEKLLNRAGTTFRKLPDEAKQDIDTEYPGGLLVGFKAEEWAAALG